ncbi:hypothetical protein ACH4VR_40330 [Streptomyces sp. NPDC020883]|uniref:hypothetical protein n=1 Tax=Streptomyces sp. NPDC020883 TaxID=3365099 RepID=UPI0037A37628
MPKTQASRRARDYARYTGAPRQLACDVVASLAPGAPLIPTPTQHAQLLFESEIFYQILGTQRHYFEYPLGIRYVEPTADGVRLHLDSSKSLDSLLRGLLPRRVSHNNRKRDEIYGLYGVRICARTDHGIELRRLGQPTSLKLTGLSRRAFARAEAKLLRWAEEDGAEACWRAEGDWTACERQWDVERQPLIYVSTWRDAAWLPSGLLRRLGLLHTVAVPQIVTGHEARLGELWILRLDHFPDTGLRRAELVEALTDPDNGLPLQLQGHRKLVPGGSLGLVLLKAADGTALQLRYDRLDHPVKNRAETCAAIRHRISKITGEAALPPMPDGRASC